MTVEIGRRLLGGVWKTGPADESAPGGSQPAVWTDPIPISSAELLTLYDIGGVEMVAAPGPGKVIVPLVVNGLLGPATAAYAVTGFVGLGADAFSSNWEDIASWMTSDPDDSGALTTKFIRAEIPRLVNVDFGVDYVDKPLFFCSSDNLTAGDADLELVVQYIVRDIVV